MIGLMQTVLSIRIKVTINYILKENPLRKYLLLLAVTVSFLTGFTGIAHGNSRSSPDEILICDRIQRQGLCEEYRLHSLSTADKQLMTKYCTRGTSCPEEKRIGRCLKFKDPDGIISDKHYYSGTTKNHKLQPSFIKETCINNGGSFLDN